MKISWSLISILSRFAAVGIGLVQSIIIVKLVSTSDYGLINLVTSIGAIVGVYQNLGISSGSTREIAAARDRKEAFKVFIGSLLVRYAISLPLVLGLFALAPYIGGEYYNRPEIIWPIRIFAITLFVQALQSVLNSVIQGLKEFKFLFIFQVAIALVSVATYIPLIIMYGFMGFYYALLAFNIISTAVLLFYTFKLFGSQIELPNKSELVSITKAVFSIGLYIYLIKILIVQWERLGPLVLGTTVSDEVLGILGFALLVTSKIIVISDAITDVSLPSMTGVYEKSRETFKDVFVKGNSKAYFLIMFAAVMLVLLKYHAFIVVDFIFAFIGRQSITSQYSESFAIMDPLILAFWAYSHINLLKSGLSVPMRKMWPALVSTALMFGLTILFYNLIGLDPLMGFSVAMGVGALVAYLIYFVLVKQTVGFYPMSRVDLLFTVISLVFIGLYYLSVPVLLLAVGYLAVTYYLYAKNYRR